ncbi:MAG TPA: hypothetical protein V6D20_24365 [Candidatus Obscuribacterales bacterium]
MVKLLALKSDLNHTVNPIKAIAPALDNLDNSADWHTPSRGCQGWVSLTTTTKILKGHCLENHGGDRHPRFHPAAIVPSGQPPDKVPQLQAAMPETTKS